MCIRDRNNLGGNVVDTRTGRPDMDRGSAATAARLALSDAERVQASWWWLQMELPDAFDEERQDLALYCLRCIKQDLRNAGYVLSGISEFDLTLQLQCPGGQVERIMWVQFDSPYVARAVYIRYNDQNIPVGEGRSITIYLYNQRFREQLSRPGLWDQVLNQGSIAPRALSGFLPPIDGSPTDEYGQPRMIQDAPHAYRPDRTGH